MHRRKFLERSLWSSLAIYGLISCKPEGPQKNQNSREFAFELDELGIRELQAGMEAGKYSAERLVELYLERIELIDRNGPALNSIIEINPDALAIARSLDIERENGKLRGSLHGIPFLLKDNIDTGDKMMTTAGSLALSGNYAKQDAPIVRQLRDHGAVVLGKTNLSEWANFRSTRSSSGWSSRGGQTKNPYILDRNPCGSSSGSGTAVAANLAAFAIGTETNGSISCPASVNGIVGLKPTVGLVSRTGIIPISATQDTAGPMTRSVEDAAIVLSAISAADPQDPGVHPRPADLPEDYTQFLKDDALNGKRIGFEKSFFGVHEQVDVILREAMRQMKAAGAEVIEVDYKSRLDGINDSEYTLLKYEFKDGLNKYLLRSNGRVKSLADVIAFNNENAEKVMPFFKQEILESSQELADVSSADYKNALDTVLTISRKAIDDIMRSEKLDCLCGPATGAAWCTDLVNGDAFSGFAMYSGAAMAGYPHITVPMGEVHGLPVGLVFMAGPYEEPELLAIASTYERKSRNRKAPAFLKTVFTARVTQITAEGSKAKQSKE